MSKKLSREDAATLIWDALVASPEGLAREDLKATTELTQGQLERGIACIKDLFRLDRKQPIIVSPAPDYRYQLTDNNEDSIGYLVMTTAGLHKRLERARGGVVSHVLKFKPTEGRIFEKSMDRLVEDLGDLLTLLQAAS